MPEPIIKIKDLEITYNKGKDNEFKATKGVNLEIYPEEYVAFFGPSGCGKSTLFYSILGILEPSGGELLVKGKNPYKSTVEEMVNFQASTIGIIYQAFYLINSISVMDNIALPQIFQGISPHKRNKRAMELLKRFEISEKANFYPDNLSGGQLQRASVARSMVNNPDILLADEPTGNLDSISTKQVMDALEEINQRDRKTVIMITHNAAQLKYCHRVFYMKDGLLSRVVPNPEKKQIAKVDKTKILVTEIEQLSRMYPYDSPDNLKVKSLVNYLTQDLNLDQLARFEGAIKVMVDRKTTAEKFTEFLVASFDDGGVGLNKPRALKVTDKIVKILEESKDVQRYRRRLLKGVLFTDQEVLVKNITEYLLADYHGQYSPEQKTSLRTAVFDRLVGNFRKEGFEDRLASSLKDGGVGFNSKTAHNLTLHLEKILIQGLETANMGE
jgi:ABC-type lipoprotein export system ATPase subunit